MSPLPTQMANHWWQRPGRYPGRYLYQWHLAFHDQPKVRQLAEKAQVRLEDQAGLDMVAPRLLHLTTYIVGFVDEIAPQSVEAMIEGARQRLALVPPIQVTVGKIGYHPQAVSLLVKPLGALNPILDAVREATEGAGCHGHIDTDPWVPHISVAYSHASGPAAPIIDALGRSLPETEITVRSISLVSQTQVDRSWQWEPVAEVFLTGPPARQVANY